MPAGTTGCWGTKASDWARSRSDIEATSRPSIWIEPADRRRTPAVASTKVVLPAPLGPTTVCHWPDPNSSDTSCSNGTDPAVTRNWEIEIDVIATPSFVIARARQKLEHR